MLMREKRMISIYIKVREIDYEKTAEFLLPVALEKWRDEGILCRFFQVLGSAALPILIGIMAGLSPKEKSELLYFLVYRYENELNFTVSKIIKDNSLEKIISIDKIKMDIQEGIMILAVGGICINYKSLIHNESVKSQIMSIADKLPANFPGGIGIKKLMLEAIIMIIDILSTMVPNQVEKQIISLVQKDDSRKSLVEFLMQSLKEKGVYIDIVDVLIEQVSESEEAPYERAAYRGKSIFPEYLENTLCDSVASYLRRVALGEKEATS